MSSHDIEMIQSSPSLKASAHSELDKSASVTSSTASILKPSPIPEPQSRWQRLIAKVMNVEKRGIGPVPLEEREAITPSTTLHMLLMWFSMTLATNTIVVGSMGTLVLELSFMDAALCAVFGCLVGVCTIGYISTWGPRSGNRTLVCQSYSTRKIDTYQ
jgi:hypothetical protein